jgi:hypothetical protein
LMVRTLKVPPKTMLNLHEAAEELWSFKVWREAMCWSSHSWTSHSARSSHSIFTRMASTNAVKFVSGGRHLSARPRTRCMHATDCSLADSGDPKVTEFKQTLLQTNRRGMKKNLTLWALSIPAHVSTRQHTSAHVRQHTSAYVSIRQHTSAYVSIQNKVKQQLTTPLKNFPKQAVSNHPGSTVWSYHLFMPWIGSPCTNWPSNLPGDAPTCHPEKRCWITETVRAGI